MTAFLEVDRCFAFAGLRQWVALVSKVSRNDPSDQRLIFVSSNPVWGGSEELWSLTAIRLAERGASVLALKPMFEDTDSRVMALRAAGCRVDDLGGSHVAPRKARRLLQTVWRVAKPLMLARLRAALRRHRPDLVVISQGINFDAWFIATLCREAGVPYVMISQKASDLHWPADHCRPEFIAAHEQAAASFFVSEHNRHLTEEQIGRALSNGQVVRNPFKAAFGAPPPAWPDDTGDYRLLCLGRLNAREKGQDLLLRVLAMPHWRERPLSVYCYGEGHNGEGLQAMAAHLGLDNIHFKGQIETPETLWQNFHALILPSRCEGLPLSIIEAMLHARPTITTNVGGNAEMVEDGVSGFVAGAATVSDLDATMERAWSRRADWQKIGQAAYDHARATLPPDPVETFAQTLIEIAAQSAR